MEDTKIEKNEGSAIDDQNSIDEQAELAAASEHMENEPLDFRKMGFIVKLKVPYEFEGKVYEEVDVSGVQNFTTNDAVALDKTMMLLQHNPGSRKFHDTLYMKHLAIKATGLSVEFFSNMPMKDFEDIKSRLMIYFLFE